MTQTSADFIKTELQENNVVLFMKGSPVFPQCGFSSMASQILKLLGVEFKGIDVLQDQGLREGVKSYTNWPTIPQLYVKGTFVGGADIMKEMFETGELLDLFEQNGISVSPQS